MKMGKKDYLKKKKNRVGFREMETKKNKQRAGPIFGFSQDKHHIWPLNGRDDRKA